MGMASTYKNYALKICKGLLQRRPPGNPRSTWNCLGKASQNSKDGKKQTVEVVMVLTQQPWLSGVDSRLDQMAAQVYHFHQRIL